MKNEQQKYISEAARCSIEMEMSVSAQRAHILENLFEKVVVCSMLYAHSYAYAVCVWV